MSSSSSTNQGLVVSSSSIADALGASMRGRGRDEQDSKMMAQHYVENMSRSKRREIAKKLAKAETSANNEDDAKSPRPRRSLTPPKIRATMTKILNRRTGNLPPLPSASLS